MGVRTATDGSGGGDNGGGGSGDGGDGDDGKDDGGDGGSGGGDGDGFCSGHSRVGGGGDGSGGSRRRRPPRPPAATTWASAVGAPVVTVRAAAVDLAAGGGRARRHARGVARRNARLATAAVAAAVASAGATAAAADGAADGVPTTGGGPWSLASSNPVGGAAAAVSAAPPPDTVSAPGELRLRQALLAVLDATGFTATPGVYTSAATLWHVYTAAVTAAAEAGRPRLPPPPPVDGGTWRAALGRAVRLHVGVDGNGDGGGRGDGSGGRGGALKRRGAYAISAPGVPSSGGPAAVAAWRAAGRAMGAAARAAAATDPAAAETRRRRMASRAAAGGAGNGGGGGDAEGGDVGGSRDGRCCSRVSGDSADGGGGSVAAAGGAPGGRSGSAENFVGATWRYADELLVLGCGPLLLSLRLFPNAKELTESFGALAAARTHLARPPAEVPAAAVGTSVKGGGSAVAAAVPAASDSDIPLPSLPPASAQRLLPLSCPDVLLVVVGDGSTPRTATTFALRTRWAVASVDPAASADTAAAATAAVDRLAVTRGRIQDVVVAVPLRATAVLLLWHAHVSIADALDCLVVEGGEGAATPPAGEEGALAAADGDGGDGRCPGSGTVGGAGARSDGAAVVKGWDAPSPVTPRGRLVDVAAIVCSCCNWDALQSTLGGALPDVTYDDAAVASARRTVRVWRPRPMWVPFA
ncbi:hypothetical protein MMPV_001218 [Pyropia vietnamensis]